MLNPFLLRKISKSSPDSNISPIKLKIQNLETAIQKAEMAGLDKRDPESYGLMRKDLYNLYAQADPGFAKPKPKPTGTFLDVLSGASSIFDFQKDQTRKQLDESKQVGFTKSKSESEALTFKVKQFVKNNPIGKIVTKTEYGNISVTPTPEQWFQYQTGSVQRKKQIAEDLSDQAREYALRTKMKAKPIVPGVDYDPMKFTQESAMRWADSKIGKLPNYVSVRSKIKEAVIQALRPAVPSKTPTIMSLESSVQKGHTNINAQSLRALVESEYYKLTGNTKRAEQIWKAYFDKTVFNQPSISFLERSIPPSPDAEFPDVMEFLNNSQNLPNDYKTIQSPLDFNGMVKAAAMIGHTIKTPDYPSIFKDSLDSVDFDNRLRSIPFFDTDYAKFWWSDKPSQRFGDIYGSLLQGMSDVYNPGKYLSAPQDSAEAVSDAFDFLGNELKRNELKGKYVGNDTDDLIKFVFRIVGNILGGKMGIVTKNAFTPKVPTIEPVPITKPPEINVRMTPEWKMHGQVIQSDIGGLRDFGRIQKFAQDLAGETKGVNPNKIKFPLDLHQDFYRYADALKEKIRVLDETIARNRTTGIDDGAFIKVRDELRKEQLVVQRALDQIQNRRPNVNIVQRGNPTPFGADLRTKNGVINEGRSRVKRNLTDSEATALEEIGESIENVSNRIESLKKMTPDQLAHMGPGDNIQGRMNQLRGLEEKRDLIFRKLSETGKVERMTPAQLKEYKTAGVFNAAKRITSVTEIPALLGQFIVGAAASPSAAFSAVFKKGLTQGIKSQADYERVFVNLRNSPHYEEAISNGLAISEDVVTKRGLSSGDKFADRFNGDLNPVGMVERSNGAGLARLRMNLYSSHCNLLEKMKGRKLTPAEVRELCDYVNVMTGHASGKTLDAFSSRTSSIFSSRQVVAGLQMGSFTPLVKAVINKNPQMAVLVLKDYASMVALAYTTAKVAEQTLGVKFDFDPRSANFMKAKFGQLTIDGSLGLADSIRTLNTLRDNGMNAPGAMKIAGDLAMKKGTPIPGTAYGVAVGERSGHPMNLSTADGRVNAAKSFGMGKTLIMIDDIINDKKLTIQQKAKLTAYIFSGVMKAEPAKPTPPRGPVKGGQMQPVR